MNIDDVEIDDVELTIDSVFAQQHILMEKYREIEGRHGEVNLDTKEGQARVKDFLWRITEEVGEALDSNLGSSHIKEELADALHFLVELCIFTGREEVAKAAIYEGEVSGFGHIPTLQGLWIRLANVGRTCKNKPWKQTQVPMDHREFTGALVDLINCYMQYCIAHAFSVEGYKEIYFFYHKKAKVNEFRQRSKY